MFYYVFVCVRALSPVG